MLRSFYLRGAFCEFTSLSCLHCSKKCLWRRRFFQDTLFSDISLVSDNISLTLFVRMHHLLYSQKLRVCNTSKLPAWRQHQFKTGVGKEILSFQVQVWTVVLWLSRHWVKTRMMKYPIYSTIFYYFCLWAPLLFLTQRKETVSWCFFTLKARFCQFYL